MKKYISGIIATGFAICITGFTALPKKLSTETVVYTGNVYSLSDVEDPANWYVMTPPSCFGIDQACEIIIDDAYIDWATWTLSSNVRIDVNGTVFSGYAP